MTVIRSLIQANSLTEILFHFVELTAIHHQESSIWNSFVSTWFAINAIENLISWVDALKLNGILFRGETGGELLAGVKRETSKI